MKKLLLVFGIVFSVSVSILSAQVEGPDAGKFGVTVDVSPLLGKIFSGNNPYVTVPYGISGKYYFSSSSGIRLDLGMGYGSNTETQYTLDNSDNPTNTVSRVITSKSGNTFHLGIGYEMRKTANKIQVSFGPKLIYNYASGSTYIYDYQNPAATTGDVLESDGGGTHTIGLAGFLGIEYFLSSNISIGTEFSISANYSGTSRDVTKTKSMPDVMSEYKNTSFNFGINNVGSILVSVYF